MLSCISIEFKLIYTPIHLDTSSPDAHRAPPSLFPLPKASTSCAIVSHLRSSMPFLAHLAQPQCHGHPRCCSCACTLPPTTRARAPCKWCPGRSTSVHPVSLPPPGEAAPHAHPATILPTCAIYHGGKSGQCHVAAHSSEVKLGKAGFSASSCTPRLWERIFWSFFGEALWKVSIW